MMSTCKHFGRILVFAVCFAVAGAAAQTVQPLIAELGENAKGRVEYINDASMPLNVVVEAKSFTVSETGEISYRPLDPNIHLRLSATSFRIQPHQTYYLFYEASTQDAPAWFVIYASFSGFGLKTQQGISVRLSLPHTVYLLPKRTLEKNELRVTRADYDPSTRKLLLELENTGPSFGRVLESWMIGRKKVEAPGFPVFPHSKRQMEFTYDADKAPDKVELDFERFKIEEAVHPSTP